MLQLMKCLSSLNAILVSQLLLEAREIDDELEQRKLLSPTSVRLSCETLPDRDESPTSEIASMSDPPPSYSELFVRHIFGKSEAQWSPLAITA